MRTSSWSSAMNTLIFVMTDHPPEVDFDGVPAPWLLTTGQLTVLALDALADAS